MGLKEFWTNNFRRIPVVKTGERIVVRERMFIPRRLGKGENLKGKRPVFVRG